jgi:glutathione S-transferase
VTDIQLVIGNKNYSSWSMRAWMLLRFAELPFTEINVQLYTQDSRERVRALGGETGLVPVLLVDGHAIWDTLAIAEYLHEQCPRIWPADPFARTRARSYAGEVHSGLNAVRTAMPCNTRARDRIADRSAEVEAEIARVSEIWSRAAGEWLFGDFCAADIIFAPVAARFRTYGVVLDGAAHAYWQRLLAHPLAGEWFALGEVEPIVIDMFELPRREREASNGVL